MKPILFKTEMVRAILDNRKTVTRRIVKPQPEERPVPGEEGCYIYRSIPCGLDGMKNLAPYHPGDILYVRETWYYESHMEDMTAGEPDLPSGAYSHRYIFKADCPDYPVNVGVGQHGWRPSIHMPREAARIFLRVTDVRVERLQDITPEQIDAEGCKEFGYSIETGELMPSSPCYFSIVWNNTVKKADRALYGWEANPWVWVIEFERCERPEEGTA